MILRKKLLLIIMIIFSLLLLTGCNDGEPLPNQSKSYVIDDYSTNIVVNENNTFDIHERITANFKVYRHGIIRTIPIRNNVIRTNHKNTKNNATLSNLVVEAPVLVSDNTKLISSSNYNLSKKSGFYTIKIGNANNKLLGKVIYDIKYTYDIGTDPLKNIDEFYFNIIGTNWDTEIQKVNFKITMPKLFLNSENYNLGFSSGREGNTSIKSESSFSYAINENIITGTHDKLLPREALTIRMELPNHYFSKNGGNIFDITVILSLIISLILLIFSILLYVFFGKNKILKTIEFLPPKEYNSVEIALLYKGYVDRNDVISLLVFLASKKYLSIKIESNGYKIIKLKEYDGKNKNERIFFKGLFSGKNIVTKKHLYNSFYHTVNQICGDLNAKESKSKIIRKKIALSQLIICSFMLLTSISMAVYPAIHYLDTNTILVMIGFALFISFSIILFALKFVPLIASFIISLVFFTILPIFMMIAFPNNSLISDFIFIVSTDIFYTTSLIIKFSTILIMCILSHNFEAPRTIFGTEMLEKIKGFKRFIKTAERKKLEMLVAENPEYFYDILPFTYILGISNIWIKQFESLDLKAPNWYEGFSFFSATTFNNFLNRTMKSSSHSPRKSYGSSSSNSSSSSSNSYSSSGGGGSSGGGSSGGGSGGGGGSSW